MRAALVCLVLATSGVAAADPVLTVRDDAGGFDEIFALDAAGGRLALVRADPAGARVLEVVDVAGKGAILLHAPLGDAPPAALELTPAGVLVTSRDAKGTSAALHDLSGKILRRFGPADDVALSGETVGSLVKNGDKLEVVLADLRGARPAVKKTFVLRGDEIAALELTPLAWRAGYGQIVGRREGGFDKARDRMLNDSAATYDVAGGKWLRDEPPADVLGWTRLVKERSLRPNIEAFVLAGEVVRAVAPDDRMIVLDVPVEGRDPRSLAQQAMPDGRVVFSLVTYDDKLEIFRFDPADEAPAKVTRLLVLPRGGRELVWSASATRVAVLTKHKSFGHGGAELAVYDYAI